MNILKNKTAADISEKAGICCFYIIFYRFKLFDKSLVHPVLWLCQVCRYTEQSGTLVGCQGIDEFRAMIPAALNFGLTPVEVKEIVYQSVAYLGIGRVFPFLRAVNEALSARGVELPLPGQATTMTEDRLEAGIKAQIYIFGDNMREFYKSGPEESRHINFWLADNCFGDYYTRTGLDYKQREMITFCFLSAQGGCEPRLQAMPQQICVWETTSNFS